MSDCSRAPSCAVFEDDDTNESDREMSSDAVSKRRLMAPKDDDGDAYDAAGVHVDASVHEDLAG